MNYLLLMAGGIGNRVGAGIPKQFIEISGKPIIIYTLEKFQNNDLIDGILLVCVKGFEEKLLSLCNLYGISKVFKIVEGGKDYEHSIMNGVQGFEGIAKDEDVIQIHWAASPFVTDEIIEDNIRICKLKGNAISANKPFVLYGINNGDFAGRVLDRDTFMCMSAPQSFLFKNIKELYRLAIEKDVFSYVEPHTTNIMAELRIPIYFSKGSQTNIKITTHDDLDILKGYILMRNNEQKK